MSKKYLARSAIIASIYVVLVALNPVSYGALQLRVGGIMCAIPFFNKKYTPAIVIGVILSNLASPLGLTDVVVGSFSTFVSYLIAENVSNAYIKALIYSLIVSSAVASMLHYFLHVPILLTFVSLVVSNGVILILGVLLFSKNKTLNKLITD